MASLPGLLPAADFVVLALPFTPATAGIIGAPELSLLGRDAWIVNLGCSSSSSSGIAPAGR